MKGPRWLPAAGIMLIAAGFAWLNRGERAVVDLGLVRVYRAPVTVVVFLAFLAGMLTMLYLSLRHDRRVRDELRARGLLETPPQTAPRQAASAWGVAPEPVAAASAHDATLWQAEREPAEAPQDATAWDAAHEPVPAAAPALDSDVWAAESEVAEAEAEAAAESDEVTAWSEGHDPDPAPEDMTAWNVAREPAPSAEAALHDETAWDRSHRPPSPAPGEATVEDDRTVSYPRRDEGPAA